MTIIYSTKGYLFLALAQFVLAINFISSKLIASHCSITHLLFFRFLIGFIIISLLLWPAFTQVKQDIKNLSRENWKLLILQALCSGAFFNLLLLYGLQHTSVITASIINSTGPAFVMVLSFIFLKESIQLRQFIAIICAGVGILLLGVKDIQTIQMSGDDLYGAIFILLAMIPASLFSVFTKMMHNSLNPLTLTGFTNLINLFVFLPIFIISHDQNALSNVSFQDWFYILIYCITGGFLFFFLWYKGLNLTSVSTAGIFFGILPLWTTLLAYIFLSEKLSVQSACGMLFVVLSIFTNFVYFPFNFGQRSFRRVY